MHPRDWKATEPHKYSCSQCTRSSTTIDVQSVLTFTWPNYMSVFRVIRLLSLGSPFCRNNFVIVHHLLKLNNLKLNSSFLPESVTVTALKTELLRWESYWQRQEVNKRPGNVIETLRVASDLDTYPTLVILLRLFATIPITTATAERSFSNLKFIKNYLRRAG